jgi:hypothetical protein
MSDAPAVRIIRSEKRSKTVHARLVDGVMEVRAPVEMSDEELAPIVEKLRKRIQRRQTKKTLDDGDLEKRATDLNRRYFGGKLTWESIRSGSPIKRSAKAVAHPPTVPSAFRTNSPKPLPSSSTM